MSVLNSGRFTMGPSSAASIRKLLGLWLCANHLAQQFTFRNYSSLFIISFRVVYTVDSQLMWYMSYGNGSNAM